MGKIMTSLDSQIDDLHQQISSLQRQIENIEHKQKSARGIGKDGQFYLLECKNEPDDNLLFYFMGGRFIALNSYYDDVYSIYVVDLVEQVNHYLRLDGLYKVKKIGKQEALQYL